MRPPDPLRTLGRLGRRAAALVEQAGDGSHREFPDAPEHLGSYRRTVLARHPGSIVVLTDLHASRLDDAVGACVAAFPDASLVVVRVRPRRVELPPDSDRVRYLQVDQPAELPKLLWREPPAEVVIDLVDQGPIKGRVLAQALYTVAPGALYVIHHLPRRRGGAELEFSREDLRSRIAADEELRLSAGRLDERHESVLIEKRGRHVYKLRDAQLASGTFTGRLGPGWGTELDHRPAEEFTTRASVTLNRDDLAIRFPSVMTVRPRYLREYRDVVCDPHQAVLRGSLALPVSFHHPGRQTQQLWGGTLVDDNVDRIELGEPAERLDGTFFHLVSEFPGHFGHVMTEDLGRMWGWPLAKARYPAARLLVSAESPETTIRAFQQVLLSALGVEPADLVCIDRPVLVDRLVGAGPQFHNRRFVDPDLAQIWDRIRDTLQPEPDPTSPARIFLTRPRGGLRSCTNADALEQLFGERGFVLVRPETLPIAEQVRLFSNAEVIAGYAGSGLFSMIYSRRPGRRIVIGSSTYTASNEYLIASVKGDDYHHFWCPAELAHPEGGWTEEAFFSDYAFDFDRDGARLTALLDGPAALG